MRALAISNFIDNPQIARRVPRLRMTDAEHSPPTPAHVPRHAWALALGALGIVYGDIGTSPLYAVRECFHGAHAIAANPTNVLGVLSLVLWSLVAVVSVKYLAFIMRADNHGEGGIFALLALVPEALTPSGVRFKAGITLFALFGAALLYGDGIITPAISVLSAVEGLGIATSALAHTVVPITVAILVGLFLLQRRGTAGIGQIFGPVMLLWFFAIAALGVRSLLQTPSVLAAVNPWHAVRFFIENRGHGFVVLGSVVLCITGGEALYADMGHFGPSPIRRTWFLLVLPGLVLNYFGQGALLLRNASMASNPFYGLVPAGWLYPMVALSTLAAIIASQAMISGAFSLTRQAVQLGYCPRVTIVHTSGEHEGQIYIPEVNAILAVLCVALVLEFGESSRLAAAYGIAVTGTMAITSLVYAVVITKRWHWRWWQAAILTSVFLVFDAAFFGASLLKFFDGGWVPVAVAAGVFTLMTTWQRGRKELAERFIHQQVPLHLFLEDVRQTHPHRVTGTAVFMASNTRGAPPVLLHHLKHNQVLHQQVILLSIVGVERPTVSSEERVELEELGEGFFRVNARYGFMQSPSVPDVLRVCRRMGLKTEASKTSFYLGRETLLSHGRFGMSRWRKVLFSFVARNARSPTAYFNIPPGRVVELGMQIDL
ncbi:MAG: potassium transporter Kup [Myxococcaceae bacterium]